MRILALQSGIQSGIENMALDEALLEWVRAAEEATLIVRTYGWDVPTLSLGVNQKAQDINALIRLYGKGESVQVIVKRPTGGRAILHGKDISYAFVTNAPDVLRKNLKDSYSIYADLVQKAFEQLRISTHLSHDAGSRDYLRSPVCFETHTPSDLLNQAGQKISGSAQLRRASGILQHGAAFLQAYGIEEADLFQALCRVTEAEFGHSVEIWTAAQAVACLPELERLRDIYRNESMQIWEKASTTSGSHLEPASF